MIGGDSGAPPRFAVPDFVALTPDAAEIAKTVGQVLWDDLNFEREFYLIPRDTYATVPQARSAEQIAFASWRELGADGVIFGTVQRTGDKVVVQVRLLNVRTRQAVFSKEYSGTASNPRLYAHTISDEIHLQQRALKGVARTKLAFASDRTRDRVAGPVANREVKEIYVSDYDGGNQQRITNTRQLNNFPSWSPDARAVAYTSYRRIVPDIFISRIYQGILENPLKGARRELPAGLLAGRLAHRVHVEPRRQPGDLRDERRRLERPPADEPSRRRLHAHLVAHRHPDRVHLRPRRAAADLPDEQRRRHRPARLTSESYADRATWAPTGLNEIAFTARNEGSYDIKVLDLSSTARFAVMTAGVAGSNESPTYLAERPAPGVHLHAQRPHARVHHRARRPRPASGDDRRQQLLPRVVEVGGRAMRRPNPTLVTMLLIVAALVADGCSRRRAASVPQPQPAAAVRAAPRASPPVPPAPRASQPVVDNQPAAAPLAADELAGRNLEELNRDNPLKPAFFPLDSAELDDEARTIVAANADVLKRYPQWVITIEGHCDERGTTEYNLALGERRAMAAKSYLHVAGHLGRSAAHGELRRRIPVRSRLLRGCLVDATAARTS